MSVDLPQPFAPMRPYRLPSVNLTMTCSNSGLAPNCTATLEVDSMNQERLNGRRILAERAAGWRKFRVPGLRRVEGRPPPSIARGGVARPGSPARGRPPGAALAGRRRGWRGRVGRSGRRGHRLALGRLARGIMALQFILAIPLGLGFRERDIGAGLLPLHTLFQQ